MIDASDFTRLVNQALHDSHMARASALLGADGVSSLERVVTFVRAFYGRYDVERLSGQLRVSAGGTAADIESQTFSDFAELEGHLDDNITVTLGEDGAMRYIIVNDAEQLPLDGRVTYHYEEGAEYFTIGDDQVPVTKIDPCALSQFAVPVLRSLRVALAEFARQSIEHSNCYLFRECWESQKRHVLKNKPEELMRKSLTQFLRTRLGIDYEVSPEQNVDETHPVDIKVKPLFAAHRLILIEIKWMGDSRTASGAILSYRDARARDGAAQLAGYLDAQTTSLPHVQHRGVLVVIDARRKGLHQDNTPSIDDLLFYRDREVAFEPDFSKLRGDFEPPRRMYARPLQ